MPAPPVRMELLLEFEKGFVAVVAIEPLEKVANDLFLETVNRPAFDIGQRGVAKARLREATPLEIQQTLGN
jgi:hypothetical protein